MVDRTVPNLPSRDLAATSAFSGGFGFVETFRDDSWMILRRSPLVLEFFPFRDLDPSASSFMCSVRVGDLDELWAAIARAGVPRGRVRFPRLTPIVEQSWGARAGYLVDLDGTQLQLIEDAGGPV